MDGFLEIHGLQVVSHDDALAELAYFFPLKHLGEFRLSGKDDLDEFFPVCFQVGDQADLLERRHFEVLGLIDHQDDGAARCILPEEKMVEGVQRALPRGGERGNPEFPVYALKQITGRLKGIEDQRRAVMIRVEMAQEGTQNRGFARSNLSCNSDESHAILDAVQKVGKRFPVGLAEKDEARIGSQVKRVFPKAVKFEVHQKIPLTPCPSPAKEKKKEKTVIRDKENESPGPAYSYNSRFHAKFFRKMHIRSKGAKNCRAYVPLDITIYQSHKQ
jgi:hypothetical protein